MARSFYLLFQWNNWLLKAVFYVVLNPVKAGMVAYAWDYPWSRVHAHYSRAHLTGQDKFGLVNIDRMLNLIVDLKHYLLEAQNHPVEDFMKHERTGRPYRGL